MIKSKEILRWIVLSAGIQLAHAQSSPSVTVGSADDSGKIEEIIVTAQRRDESLQKVPISVTAVSQESLTRNAVSDVTDLSNVVPGLHISNEIGYVTSQLRGVGTNLLSVGFENPVAIYVDGVYYASPSASLLNFSNIERVEVLKGPQGTLFGRNATGGLIQMVTKDPSHDLGGSASITYGNYEMVSGDVYIAGGLTDTIAMDLAVQASHQGEGWGRNIYDGQDNYQLNHNVSARSKWVYATDKTRVALSFDYTDTRNTLNSQTLYPHSYSGFGGGPVVSSGYDTDTNVSPYVRGKNGGASLQIAQELNYVRINSITAYRDAQLRNITDIDETPLSAEAFSLAQRDWQFSEELQLLSNQAGPLNWVLGGYFFRADGKWDPFTVTLGPPVPVPLPLNVSSYDDIGTRSIAGYAQGTLELGDHTKLTLGGRYTHETRSRAADQITTAAADGSIEVGPGVTVPLAIGDQLGPVVPFPKSDLVYNRFTPRLALDHEFTSDVLGYVSFNRGFKSGGYNPAIYGETLLGGFTFQPEKLDAYEIGIKSTWLDQRVRMNGAAFYYNYSNIQLPFVIDTTVLTINGAKARIYGVDGDFEVRISSALRLTGGLQAINDEYLEFPAAPTGTPQGGVPLVSASAKGHKLSFVPSTTVNAGFDYTIAHVARGSANLGVNAAYNSGYYLSPDNLHRQDAFVFLNATAKWTSASRFSIGLYGKNLVNYRTIASFQEDSNGGMPIEWAAPRTFGVTFGYKF
jgi:iron complex outermembrane receptor protein